jgi:hypothetical protein
MEIMGARVKQGPMDKAKKRVNNCWAPIATSTVVALEQRKQYPRLRKK